jgi:hypothetical protein
MSRKSVYAALVAAFLLHASSWAAACEVACMLRGHQSGCQVFSNSSHGLSSVSHVHCAYMRGHESSKITATVAATSNCRHTFCGQLDSLIDPVKSVRLYQVQWAVIHQTQVSQSDIAPSRFVSEAPPPGTVASDNPLTVALRI